MAKYDWKQLEQEYILSNYKSVSAFFKSKGIKSDGTTRKYASGWNEKKRQKDDRLTTETIEKVIEIQSDIDAQKIVDVKSVANDLLKKIIQANDELNMHLAKSKKKTKKVKYDYKTNKPKEEVIEEDENIKSYISIIDRNGLKQLTSALSDLNNILMDNKEKENKDTLNKLDEVLNNIKGVV